MQLAAIKPATAPWWRVAGGLGSLSMQTAKHKVLSQVPQTTKSSHVLSFGERVYVLLHTCSMAAQFAPAPDA